MIVSASLIIPEARDLYLTHENYTTRDMFNAVDDSWTAHPTIPRAGVG